MQTELKTVAILGMFDWRDKFGEEEY